LKELESSENFFNEIKGHFFEYLIGLKISQRIGKEGVFLQSLGPEYRGLLERYQKILISDAPEIYRSLPVLADKSFTKLNQEGFFSDTSEVCLLGKKVQEGDRSQGETDLILFKNSGNKVPLSLKLSKLGSEIHAKNAGVKSFFSQYFNFPDSMLDQEKFNLRTDQAFNKMAHKLHDLQDMTYQQNFEAWKSKGLPDHPGTLEGAEKEVLTQAYNEIITVLYEQLVKYKNINQDELGKSLIRLCGLGTPGLVQVQTFYKKNIDGSYQFNNVHTMNSLSEDDVFQYRINAPERGRSSFEVEFPFLTLRLRVKAMNVFTVPAYKINCSIKLKAD